MPIAIGVKPSLARWDTGIIVLVHAPRGSFGEVSEGYAMVEGHSFDCLKYSAETEEIL